MKCLTKTQGSKVRINAVLPGLLLTEWVSDNSLGLDKKLTALQGQRFPQEKIDAWTKATTLKKVVSNPDISKDRLHSNELLYSRRWKIVQICSSRWRKTHR